MKIPPTGILVILGYSIKLLRLFRCSSIRRFLKNKRTSSQPRVMKPKSEWDFVLVNVFKQKGERHGSEMMKSSFTN